MVAMQLFGYEFTLALFLDSTYQLDQASKLGRWAAHSEQNKKGIGHISLSLPCTPSILNLYKKIFIILRVSLLELSFLIFNKLPLLISDSDCCEEQDREHVRSDFGVILAVIGRGATKSRVFELSACCVNGKVIFVSSRWEPSSHLVSILTISTTSLIRSEEARKGAILNWPQVLLLGYVW